MTQVSRKAYAAAYRGVFKSPIDYDLNTSLVMIARLKQKQGKELEVDENEACKRLAKLEELGGINITSLPEEYHYQLE